MDRLNKLFEAVRCFDKDDKIIASHLSIFKHGKPFYIKDIKVEEKEVTQASTNEVIGKCLMIRIDVDSMEEWK